MSSRSAGEEHPAHSSTARSPSWLYANRALRFEHLASREEVMAACLERARIAASSRIEVLIVGETGTGKNLLALAMHHASPCAHGPFIELNTAAIPDDLIESELFGHEKGAFTGAGAEKRGLLELADGGTLFLDEIGNMGSQTQRKLLTALESRRFFRVGGTVEKRVSVRLISATNADLGEALEEGTFRQDLYYRLARVVVSAPPLRERQGDILPLARAFLEQARVEYGRPARAFSAACEQEMLGHSWPGNVRELRNTVVSAVAMTPLPVLEPEHVFPGRASPPPSPEPGSKGAEDGDWTLLGVERSHIARVLLACGGNISLAAGRMGISRQALYAKGRRHGLLPPADPPGG